jgi:hypothetical protein
MASRESNTLTSDRKSYGLIGATRAGIRAELAPDPITGSRAAVGMPVHAYTGVAAVVAASRRQSACEGLARGGSYHALGQVNRRCRGGEKQEPNHAQAPFQSVTRTLRGWGAPRSGFLLLLAGLYGYWRPAGCRSQS